MSTINIRSIFKGLAITVLTIFVLLLFQAAREAEGPGAVELEYRSWLAELRSSLRSKDKASSSIGDLSISVEGIAGLSWSLTNQPATQAGSEAKILRLLDQLAEARLTQKGQADRANAVIRIQNGERSFVYHVTNDEIDRNIRLQLFFRLGLEYAKSGESQVITQ